MVPKSLPSRRRGWEPVFGLGHAPTIPGGSAMTRMVDVKELPGMIGQEIGVSDWIKVDQDRIDKFAELCGDHQWIHVDVERAKREIGGTIAHGFLTLSLMSTMSAQIMRVKDVKRGVNTASTSSASPAWFRPAARSGCA